MGGKATKPTRDHIVPLARGGEDRSWNIVFACTKCNQARGDSWPTCECFTCQESIRRHAKFYGITETSLRGAIRWKRGRVKRMTYK
jgi:CRISPR/Cas system Type II protein with McrA/HNH and RuvC-like nuclease domain